jgi:hypothetical protein
MIDFIEFPFLEFEIKRWLSQNPSPTLAAIERTMRSDLALLMKSYLAGRVWVKAYRGMKPKGRSVKSSGR